jgi:hypothetical protein
MKMHILHLTQDELETLERMLLFCAENATEDEKDNKIVGRLRDRLDKLKKMVEDSYDAQRQDKLYSILTDALDRLSKAREHWLQAGHQAEAMRLEEEADKILKDW